MLPEKAGPPRRRQERMEGMRRGGWRQRALVRAFPYLRPLRGRIALIIGCTFVSTAAYVAMPLVVKAVIDGPIARHDRAAIVHWAFFAMALAIGEMSLNHVRRAQLAVISTELETALRDDLYRQMQRLDLGFHDRWQSGQLLSRAMTDLAIVRRFIGFGAVFFVLIGIQVLAIFGVLLTLHVWLTLLTFVAAVPIVWLCGKFQREYHEIVRRLQDQTGDLTTSIEEGAKGVRIIKAFGRWREVHQAYVEECQRIHDTQIDRIKLHTEFVWVLGIIPNLTLTGVLLAGVLA